MHARLIIFFMALGMAANSYSQLQISAELRPRVLVDNGYSTLRPADTPPRIYVTQRTRLNTLFKTGTVETYISIQDVRYWGDDDNFKASGTFGNTSSISLHQGWILLRPATWLSVKAGRQIFSYDDQRILSSRGWNDSQVTYDAVLVKAADDRNQVDLGLSWNAESDRLAVTSPYKFRTFDFLRYQGTLERMKFSLITLLTGNTVSGTTDRVRYGATWGANMNYSGSPVEGRGSFYYQHHLNLAGGKASAFCGSVNVGVRMLEERMKWSVGLDYISGQNEASDNSEYLETDHTFNLLYGRRHAWYGYMDYFSNMPDQGLQDYMVKGEFRLSGELLLQADYHYFRLAARMLDPDPPGDVLPKQLGHELDLTLVWTLSKEAVLQAGYSVMVTNPTLEIIKGVSEPASRLPGFAYLMITVTPEFSLDLRQNR